ncbi:MAG: ParB/RepB/Spo0J family partition protein [Candidatus Nomurabacteria bacterium]|nr:ParB/RepB/Spo0J family partition protein [Candidatus Nomurabacteria bacterium]USN87702.1 MAG: ParB/RepB/Spo0J family partition protein [Candidatus Nomurabacteria bacterium]
MAFQGDSIFWVEVEKIVPNPYQPRREFDEQKLQELAESVRMYGILQPLTVTRNEVQRGDGTFYTEYELVAGERRLRASKLAGLTQVPVIIRDGENNDQEKLELAIIENLQREDLNSVDRAIAFKQLADTFGLSHSQVAKKVGRSREYVSNSIRLLGLPDYMLSALRKGELTEGHARTLLMLNDKPEEQDVVFREILLKKLSVRELEKIVRKIATDKVRKKAPGEFDTELIEMEKEFMETLGTRVHIQKTEYGGQLTIDYFSVDDLEMILKRMKDDHIKMQLGASGDISKLETHTPLTTIKEDETVSSKVDEEELMHQEFDEIGLHIHDDETRNSVYVHRDQSHTQESSNTSNLSDDEKPDVTDVQPEPVSVSDTDTPTSAPKVSGDHYPRADYGNPMPQSPESPVLSPTQTDVQQPSPAYAPVKSASEAVGVEVNHNESEYIKPTVESSVSSFQSDQNVSSNPTKPPVKNTDDSDLYSIRNFTV